MITISERAAQRIRELLEQQEKRDLGLRISVVAGGCSGLQWKMDLDVERAGDRVFERDGAKVLTDLKSFVYLSGAEVDYREGLMDSGFKLRNPNARRSCGCGASFGV